MIITVHGILIRSGICPDGHSICPSGILTWGTATDTDGRVIIPTGVLMITGIRLTIHPGTVHTTAGDTVHTGGDTTTVSTMDITTAIMMMFTMAIIRFITDRDAWLTTIAQLP